MGVLCAGIQPVGRVDLASKILIRWGSFTIMGAKFT